MTVSVVVTIFTVRDDALHVLLIERAAEPFAHAWALPGGVVRPGNTLDATATQRLAGETGVADVFLEQLYTFDGGEWSDAVVAYFALVDRQRTRLRRDLEWRPAWHPVANLPPLAFSNEVIVARADERLRSKLEYTNVAYSLLPEQFTLTQMQRVYEAILGEPVDKRNFRRRMVGLGLVEPTGSLSRGGAHRPAMLYTFTSREPMVF